MEGYSESPKYAIFCFKSDFFRGSFKQYLKISEEYFPKKSYFDEREELRFFCLSLYILNELKRVKIQKNDRNTRETEDNISFCEHASRRSV